MSEALFGTGLTQGWPLSEQPGFATAGIRLGNLNLEICSVDRTQNKLDDWLTFEPTDLDTLANDLVKRDISHDPFDAVVVEGHPIYTRVGRRNVENERPTTYPRNRGHRWPRPLRDRFSRSHRRPVPLEQPTRAGRERWWIHPGCRSHLATSPRAR